MSENLEYERVYGVSEVVANGASVHYVLGGASVH